MIRPGRPELGLDEFNARAVFAAASANIARNSVLVKCSGTGLADLRIATTRLSSCDGAGRFGTATIAGCAVGAAASISSRRSLAQFVKKWILLCVTMRASP
jgi:hypothetical protein